MEGLRFEGMNCHSLYQSQPEVNSHDVIDANCQNLLFHNFASIFVIQNWDASQYEHTINSFLYCDIVIQCQNNRVKMKQNERFFSMCNYDIAFIYYLTYEHALTFKYFFSVTYCANCA